MRKKFVTTFEKIETFRGRCGFKQYIPKQFDKNGLKVFVLLDSKTKYTVNLESYVGLQPDSIYRLKNDLASTVLRMVQPTSSKGRNITCDNWFKSLGLINGFFNNL